MSAWTDGDAGAGCTIVAAFLFLALLCRLRPDLVPLCQVAALLVVLVTYLTSVRRLRP